MNSFPKPVNLLWTSGFDSTFRLLELLLLQKKIVQPYYIYDRARRSLDLEIRAMEKIKEEVFKKDPSTRLLLRPTIFKELTEIQPNPTITETYARLYKTYSIGPQNEWLSRFAEEINVNDLELSIESRINFTHPFNDVILSNLETLNDDGFYNYRLKRNFSYPDLSLFKNFRFPLIKRTKREMMRTAQEHGFKDILSHTWFCHTPHNGRPCGICKPCRITIGEGLWKRIPLYGLYLNFKVHTIRPLFIKERKIGKNDIRN